MYSTKSRYEDSIQFAFKSYEILIEVFNGDLKNANMTSTLTQLGVLYINLNQIKKAFMIFTRVLKIQKEILGEDSIPYAETCCQLANLSIGGGKFDDGEEFLIKAQKVFLRVYGENSINFASCLDQLGIISSSKGEFTKAIDLLNKSISIKESIDKECFEISISYYEICKVYLNTQKLEQFKSYFDKAVMVIKKVFGPISEELFKIYYEMLVFFLSVQEIDIAERFLNKALIIRIELFGLNDIYVNELIAVQDQIKQSRSLVQV